MTYTKLYRITGYTIVNYDYAVLVSSYANIYRTDYFFDLISYLLHFIILLYIFQYNINTSFVWVTSLYQNLKKYMLEAE